MKIKFLGTAAAEGIPAIACNCEVCEHARKYKGREIRTRLQTLINDDLLIDYGPDTYLHFIKYKLDYRKIKNILITHSHYDHFYLGDITMLRPDYVKSNSNFVNIYSGESAYKEINSIMNIGGINKILANNLLIPFKKYKIGNYDIFTLEASHNIDTSPLIYIISDAKVNILYAHDTGLLKETTYNYLKNFKLDLISIDCTEGFLELHKTEGKTRHMSFDSDIELINRLRKDNIINSNTKIIFNHFSHNGKCNYKNLVSKAKKHNVIIAFDGMEIEI